MKRSLLDVIFMSEKRKTVLLLLEDGPKDMNTLLESLQTSRNALLPQLKILEEHHLITHFDDTCGLTTIGNIVVERMVPLLNTTEVLDIDVDYWGSRDLSFIPPYLMDRIDELRSCEMINPPIHDLFSIHRSFSPNIWSPNVYVVTNLMYPDIDSIIAEAIKNKVEFNYVVSQELLNKIRSKYPDEFAKYIKSEYFKLYVCKREMKFFHFTFDTFHLVMGLLNTKGDFDHKFLICEGQGALEWIKELYEYYLKDSTLITEL
ncbi:winged helix-turn-helix domain-containing protein [Methanolobus sp. WCC4]|uniref:helix-turn-helix transcriptional regulator n=1 Tax=Methanolobus sp. WCC4 TaxID=3125784 RepID=UPI0030FB10BD